MGSVRLDDGGVIVTFVGVAGAALGAQKAAQATSRALGRRNVAQSPTVRGVIDQGLNAARRGLTSTFTKATSDVPEYAHSGLRNL